MALPRQLPGQRPQRLGRPPQRRHRIARSSGSTSAGKAGTSSRSSFSALLRPPPSRQTRPSGSGSSPPSNSKTPLRTVVSLTLRHARRPGPRRAPAAGPRRPAPAAAAAHSDEGTTLRISGQVGHEPRSVCAYHTNDREAVKQRVDSLRALRGLRDRYPAASVLCSYRSRLLPRTSPHGRPSVRLAERGLPSPAAKQGKCPLPSPDERLLGAQPWLRTGHIIFGRA